MNILFNVLSLEPSMGGVERVSAIIASKLGNLNYQCYAVYEDAGSASQQNTSSYCRILQSNFGRNQNEFEDKIASFVLENKIDVIINQRFFHQPSCRIYEKIRKMYGIRLYSFLHIVPDFYDKYQRTPSFVSPFFCYLELKLYHIYKILKKQLLIRQFRKVYRNGDGVVLLSKSFRQTFVDFCKLEDGGKKLFVINNPLSWQMPSGVVAKEKIVLITGRLDESQKRLTKALLIWQQMEKRGFDWKLLIVGQGKDGNYYRKFAEKLQLKNVSFEGYSLHPEEYYQKAAIFLMTSDYEGWPMTLLEAQQMGVVPVAYDTFSSLHEIIQHDVNGYIVPADDPGQYIAVLSGLMQNDQKRSCLQKNAMESAKRFSIEHIIKSWEVLLNGQ